MSRGQVTAGRDSPAAHQGEAPAVGYGQGGLLPDLEMKEHLGDERMGIAIGVEVHEVHVGDPGQDSAGELKIIHAVGLHAKARTGPGLLLLRPPLKDREFRRVLFHGVNGLEPAADGEEKPAPAREKVHGVLRGDGGDEPLAQEGLEFGEGVVVFFSCHGHGSCFPASLPSIGPRKSAKAPRPPRTAK